jgi:Leucine-rich repeat (LRR) protein
MLLALSTELPDAVRFLGRLEYLNVHGNALSAIPASLNNLTKLRILIARCVPL